MGLKAIGEYVEKSKVTQFLRRALSSYYFPLVTACVTVVSYCFGLEIIGIWYIGICATAVLICCKDITPLLSLFLALQIFISIKHSSSTYITAAGSRYMYSTAVLAQEIICIVMFAIPLIARTVLGVVKGRFKITPMFWGIALLAFVLLYNGLFYTHYSIKSFLYGCSLGAVLVGVFVFSSGNLVIDGKTFVRISLYMLAFFGTLVVQMIFAYSTIDGLIVNGTVNRYYLFMGWGTYNNLGMHLTVCIPAWFYLASRTKFGWAYLLGALANVVACFLSMSRQAMIMSLVIALACCVWIIVISKGKQRIINACVIGGVVVVTAIICGAMHAKLSAFFTSVIEGFKTGSGRIELWKTSLNNFLKKPLFGVGFFDPTAAYKDVGYSSGGVTVFVPRLSHNTIFQFMSACGLVGLIAYFYHRAQTVISLINNFNNERILISLIMAAFLLCCLLDCYIFYFLPATVYSYFLAVLSSTEKKSNDAQKTEAL